MDGEAIDGETSTMEEVFEKDTNQSNNDDDDNSNNNLETLVIIEFSPKLPPPSVEWILKKITDPKAKGGAELMACTIMDQGLGDSVVHIGAPTDRLMISAELMELKKSYKDGSLREISLADIDEFMGSEDLDDFLTVAEKQKIILHELESVRAGEADNFIPGLRNITLYPGEAIIARCIHEGIIVNCFPLHNREDMNRLSVLWYKKILKPQPLDQIHHYFGETIAMYFAFLGFYTLYLAPPAALGVLSHFFDSFLSGFELVPLFCAFNLIWSTIFLEAWKRNCAVLAYRWGTIGTEPFEQARAEYYGVLGVNKVTGRLEPKYPKWKRLAKYYGVSVPIILFSLSLSFAAMLIYFWAEDVMRRFHEARQTTVSELLMLLPTVAYALIILVMNAVYRKVAISLNNWENHRLQSAYENHLITKLVLFNFFNCFMSLFYVAFYLQDMALLQKNLAALLITQQLVQQILESIIPYITYRYRKVSVERRHLLDSAKNRYCVSEDVKLQAEIERTKEAYAGTLDDYLEMFLQFGYVFLFSAVFPTAAFCALINNCTEIRTDSFKMCRIFRRPFSRSTANIGAWQVAFEMMSIIAVMTNCGLVYLSPRVQKYTSVYGSLSVILVFFLIEHIIVFIKVALSYLIPDAPEYVEVGLAAVEYQSKQAWREQRTLKSQEHLQTRMSMRSPAVQTPKRLPDTLVKRKVDDPSSKGSQKSAA